TVEVGAEGVVVRGAEPAFLVWRVVLKSGREWFAGAWPTELQPRWQPEVPVAPDDVALVLGVPQDPQCKLEGAP
ncbi:MAG: hypothetical protein AB2A00_40940, partial [Myxococcota bacterium]